MRGLTQQKSLIFFLFLILSSSIFPYKKIKVFVIEAPETILDGVQRVAVLDFDSYDELGRNFSDYLISELLNSERGITEIKTGFLGLGEGKSGQTFQEGAFTNVFGVVERSRMLEILEEQKLVLSGLIDASQAAQVGQMLGVEAIIMGSISHTYNDNHIQEKRTYKDKDKKTQTKYVRCTERTVTVNVRARVVSVASGEIIGSKEASKSKKKKKCEPNYGSLPAIPEMANELARELCSDVANYIAPYFRLEEFEFEKIKNQSFKKQAEQAAKLAEKLQIDDAYVIYQGIYRQDSYNPKVMYNIGILEEVVGNLSIAKRYYETAYQLKSKEKKYRQAVERINNNLDYLVALAELGVVLQGREWPSGEASNREKRIETKGNSEDRVSVYSKPNTAGEVAARVPGGLSFKLLGKEGDWYIIELLDGSTGYLPKKSVK